MTTPEYKSECCGADVYAVPVYARMMSRLVKTMDDLAQMGEENKCSKCHKPTTVRKEEK